ARMFGRRSVTSWRRIVRGGAGHLRERPNLPIRRFSRWLSATRTHRRRRLLRVEAVAPGGAWRRRGCHYVTEPPTSLGLRSLLGRVARLDTHGRPAVPAGGVRATRRSTSPRTPR